MISLKSVNIKLLNYQEQSISIAPLVVFRIAFGLVMLFSILRYMYLGWVDTQLVDPIIHFSYFGFEWIQPLSRSGMYLIFTLMAFSTIAIALGFYYRLFATIFFLSFTYIELIDITYYLNHYYFVSLVSFIMIWLPSNRNFSIDVWRNPSLKQEQVNRWCIDIIKFQIAIVYVYAGLAKINYDWLINALPLSIWLPAKTGIPIIGFIFKYKITAIVFSWAGMLFDTFIVLGLLWKKTRWLSYAAVVIFHTITGILFQIGVFPLVMILGVTIFFSPEFHQKLINSIASILPQRRQPQKKYPQKTNSWALPLVGMFLLFQLVFPWRYLLYPGNVFWTEEGYRFSWRVMLMEKAGTATFYVKDGPNGREGSVINHQFLNPHQEKQMAMQPDLILQFAHLLEKHFKDEGMIAPIVRAEVWVTLNAKPAQLLIDPQTDLTKLTDTWKTKDWILPFKN